MPLDAFEEFKKGLTDVPESMPTVSQVVRYDAESYNTMVEQKKLFPSPYFFKMDEKETQQKDERKRKTRVDEDTASVMAMRDRTKKQMLTPITEAEIERESKFREKERCYEEKESTQEKAALQRNEAFSGVSTKHLMDEADDLRAMLAEQIDVNDSYAMGEREYHRQYLAVIEDLIKTRASKGKLFGNYKKHIALAEEKYLFYSRESGRIIGREQAKLLMTKPGFDTELKKKQDAVIIREAGLRAAYKVGETYARDPFLSGADRKIAERAEREYNVCLEKICHIRKHIDALKAMDDEEWENREDNLPKNFDAQYRATKAIRSSENLFDYIQSLETELHAWKFQADSCRICLKCLGAGGGFMVEYTGDLTSHEAFIKEHFGVDIMRKMWSYPLRELSDSEAHKTMGFETGASDMAVNIGDEEIREEALAFFDQRWKSRNRNAHSGYQKQIAYELSAVEAGAYDVIVDFFAVENPAEGAEERKLLRKVTDMVVLTQALPALQDTKEQGKSLGFETLQFYGTRNADGEFVPSTVQQDAKQIRIELTQHMQNIDVIRSKTATADEVKRAIIAELPLVETAFDDIDAFMNVGATRNIFTAKNHFEIFDNTAGMPTFERKARQLRDLISSMLEKKDLLGQAGAESGTRDLHRKLMHKWMYLNRALSYVDYRKQLMDKGYASTMREWTRDTTGVKDFHEMGDYTMMHGRADTGRFLEDPKAAAMKGKRIVARAEVVEGEAEEGEAEEEQAHKEEQREAGAVHVSATIDEPAEGEEESWTDAEKQEWRRWKASMNKAHQDAQSKALSREAALEGLTRTEKRFLRLEYYESGRFKSREEQRNAIRKDLLKGTAHSAYIGELAAINRDIVSVQNKLKEKPSTDVKDELERQLGTLLEHQRAMIKVLNLIREEVAERTEKLLQTMTIPKNDFADVEKSLDGLFKMILSPLSDQSMSDGLRASFKDRILEIADRLSDAHGEDAIDDVEKTLREMLGDISAEFRTKAFDYSQNSPQAILNGMTSEPLSKQATIKEAVDMLSAKLQDTGMDDYDLDALVKRMATMRNKVDARMPLPLVIRVRDFAVAALTHLQSLKKDAGKTRKVFFSDKSEMVEYDEEEFSVQTVYFEELNAEHVGKVEQLDRKKEAFGEAYAEAGEQQRRAQKASGEMNTERQNYQKKISGISSGAIQQLEADGELEEETKGLLSDVISLIMPMDQIQDDAVKLFADDKEQKSVMGTYAKHIQVLRNAESSEQETKDAVDFMWKFARDRLVDLELYFGKNPGKKMLDARTAPDFWRLQGEPESHDNYTEDLEGMTVALEKATQLKKFLDMTIKGAERLAPKNQDYKDMVYSLSTDATKVENLQEFLQWREDVIKRVVKEYSTAKDDVGELQRNEYVQHVRNNPEEWNHERPMWW